MAAGKNTQEVQGGGCILPATLDLGPRGPPFLELPFLGVSDFKTVLPRRRLPGALQRVQIVLGFLGGLVIWRYLVFLYHWRDA